jgi:protein-S-isoprenylcysteine O-methyltransferase Ste14
VFPKPWADAVQRLRVPSGILLAAVFAWAAQPTWWSLLAACPLWLLGLGIRAWAAGHLRKNTTLTVSGPYAYVRNPLYVGTLLVAAGYALAARSLLFGAVVALVFLLVYQPVMENEERHLRSLFPEFDAYARQVPQLLPRGRKGADRERFEWSLYRRNKEEKALYGFLGVLFFLMVKLFWFR